MSQHTDARKRTVQIILHCMEHKRTTAAKLAAELGVSVRTIYRDMKLIVEAGAPILGISSAGAGYLWKPPEIQVPERNSR
jgi:predicted DNA-binding transcriptional regulator YafY